MDGNQVFEHLPPPSMAQGWPFQWLTSPTRGDLRRFDIRLLSGFSIGARAYRAAGTDVEGTPNQGGTLQQIPTTRGSLMQPRTIDALPETAKHLGTVSDEEVRTEGKRSPGHTVDELPRTGGRTAAVTVAIFTEKRPRPQKQWTGRACGSKGEKLPGSRP